MLTEEGKTGPKRKKIQDRNLETRYVMFVEHTREGEMAKNLREQLGRMENMRGFRMKIVERTGTKIKDMFSLTNIWGGSQCGREECTTCTQGGEDLPDCTRRSIVYESICVKCNSGAKDSGPLRTPNPTVPSIYVGESSRSIYEHAGEHWNAYKKRNTDSHIWKHHLIHHDGEGEPQMIFKVVGTFMTALSRKVTEAVRIRGRGASVLNSKGEYDRSKIHRLTIGTEELGVNGTESQEDWNSSKDVENGENFLLEKRKKLDRNNRMEKRLQCGLVKSQKRGMCENEGSGRQSKRRKYVLVGHGWGQYEGGKELGLNCKKENISSMGVKDMAEDDETGPLDGQNGVENTLSTEKGNIQDLVQNTGVSMMSFEGGNQTCIGNRDEEGGTGPLPNRNITEDEGMASNIGTGCKRTIQKSVTDYMRPSMNEGGGMRDDTAQNEDTLYDTANNVNLLRSMRGNCVVRDGMCQEHGDKARRVTQTKEVWTRNKRTGLYYYKRRKVSVVRCNGKMGTFVGQLDGAGVSTGTAGDRG